MKKLQNLLRNATIAFGFAVAGLILNSYDEGALAKIGIGDDVINKAKTYITTLTPEKLEDTIERAKVL